jgi:hypothetical protein
MKVSAKVKEELKECPVCLHSRFLNRLSKDNFFCVSCLNEFSVKKGKTYWMEINGESGEVKPRLHFKHLESVAVGE